MATSRTSYLGGLRTENEHIRSGQKLITFPKNNFSAKEKAIFEAVTKTCPVALSLHPDVKLTVKFNW